MAGLKAKIMDKLTHKSHDTNSPTGYGTTGNTGELHKSGTAGTYSETSGAGTGTHGTTGLDSSSQYSTGGVGGTTGQTGTGYGTTGTTGTSSSYGTTGTAGQTGAGYGTTGTTGQTGYSTGTTGVTSGEPVSLGRTQHTTGTGEIIDSERFTKTEDHEVLIEKKRYELEHRPVQKEYVVETRYVGETAVQGRPTEYVGSESREVEERVKQAPAGDRTIVVENVDVPGGVTGGSGVGGGSTY